MSDWTTPADVRRRAERRWKDGSVLRAYVAAETCPRLDVPIRGPTPREIGSRFAEVRSWRDALIEASQDGATYTLTERVLGGRVIGRVDVPERAVVAEYAQWWRLLRAWPQVRALDAVVAATRESHPALLPWVQRRPRAAIAAAPDWDRLTAAVDWLARESGGGRYLREVTAPGVDTKFIEHHAGVLTELLTCLGVPGSDRAGAPRSFAVRHGFAEPERLVRLRVDPALRVLPAGADEVGLRLDQAALLDVAPHRVLLIENQVTYLSVPVPSGGIVVWGHGFDAIRLGRLPWLRACADVWYWGDLDTHGFAILNHLRSQLPAIVSVLMDRRTLFAHWDRWVTEPRPTRADLPHLTAVERQLYEELVEDVHGPAIRLEQEREAWDFCLTALRSLDELVAGSSATATGR